MAGLTKLDVRRFVEFSGLTLEASERACSLLEEFGQWLLYEPEGDEALRHINETKRQRFLPFDSQQ